MPKEHSKPELLAPAGREDAFHAVLEAGADAVYLAGKAFNMRRHRRDYNFSEADLARLTRVAHEARRRLYVTVNILVGETELPALLSYLRFLEGLGVDGLIVQDLAVLQLCQEHGLRLPLHASTMMNVGSVAQARWLQTYGVSRAVTSRDITLEQVRRLRAESGIEVEYFIHGDLCSVQSGQCLLSGIVFGKSSNRGQCMKPCRWSYDLLSLETGAVLSEQAYLLAAKDMCLAQQLPSILEAGVDALKIEGRMRSAETLRAIVAAYRELLDRSAAEPAAAIRQRQQAAAWQQRRVRNLTTGFACKTPGPSFFDLSGQREPVFLSRSGHLRTVEEAEVRPHAVDSLAAPSAAEGQVGRGCQYPTPVARSTRDRQSPRTAKQNGRDSSIGVRPAAPLPARRADRVPRLAVTVGTQAGANAALAAGVDELVLGWEGDLTAESSWPLSEVRDLAAACQAGGVPLLATTPRICTERELHDLARFVEALPSIEEYRITTPAALPLLRQAGRRVWAGPETNVLNSAAARLLSAAGCSRLTPALEASLQEVELLAAGLGPLELDLAAYGPLPAMVVEHCLIAMASQGIGKDDPCHMPCMADRFALRDRRGNVRPLRADRYCRNHVLLEHTLCVLPLLDRVLALKPASLSLDLRLCTPAALGPVVQAFRQALADPSRAEALYQELRAASPTETFTCGAYLVGITGDEAISRLDLVREERDADDR